ncbi:PIN domain-containing protein [Streptomyces lushanensis]|uniref:PIN domain-containing protein n=1 Tax=Streptomyces lushanensis TaxID=1434255 RepID=UPI00082DC26F|nr:PIN domain-containing protein [Streptomyces lushanensis]
MIVLDTNQLRSAVFPHGAVMNMLTKIAELNERPLAIPRMVAVEDIAHHQHAIEDALKDARKAAGVLDHALGSELMTEIRRLSGSRAAATRWEALDAVFKILPTPPGAAEEALRREANRQPPAEQTWVDSNGKSVKARGARDVTIWLSILEAARSTDGEVWFVSQDADFGRDDFHPLLRQEAQRYLRDGHTRLRLLNGGIEQLLSELAERSDEPKELGTWLQADVIGEAVSAQLVGSHTFFRLMPESDILPARGMTSTGTEVSVQEVRRRRTYRVGGHTWVSAQLRCRGLKKYSFLRGSYFADEQGEMERWWAGTEFSCDVTVLAEVLSTGLSSIEITSVGHLAITATSQSKS